MTRGYDIYIYIYIYIYILWAQEVAVVKTAREGAASLNATLWVSQDVRT